MSLSVAELVNEDASLVSRRCWSDQRVYELEKQGIFGRSWLFLGHESQIPNPGDFVQAFMCETPIILARGEDGIVEQESGPGQAVDGDGDFGFDFP